tara:strand:+ start:249 stop:791 length:543 start_codon:yes stop_codon:yes gene_type:complete
MSSIKNNLAEDAEEASSKQTDDTNTKYAMASYNWQTFLIDYYRRVKQYYNFDFDSFMIIIVTISHITHENYKDDPGVPGTYADFIKGFKNIAPGSLSKRKLGINAISNILEMPEETTRRKIEKLIKVGLLSKSKTDGIILSETFIEKNFSFADQTIKNLGKLIRTFDKTGLLNAAKNFKM